MYCPVNPDKCMRSARGVIAGLMKAVDAGNAVQGLLSVRRRAILVRRGSSAMMPVFLRAAQGDRRRRKEMQTP